MEALLPQPKHHKPSPRISQLPDLAQSGDNHNFLDDTSQEQHDFWSNCALFAIDTTTLPALPNVHVERDSLGNVSQNSRKRKRSSLSWDIGIGGSGGRELDLTGELSSGNQHWIVSQFPELFPLVPLVENRVVDLTIPNPFLEDSPIRHNTLRPSKSLPEDGAVNGYIKFRIRFSSEDSERRPKVQNVAFGQPSFATHHKDRHPITGEHVPSLPPDFGRGCKLSPMDSKLKQFYLTAFCSGRSLLPKTNFWLCDIAPIADKIECVNHALLALAATYVLDYKPMPELQARANYHYKRAVDLVSEAIRDTDSHEVGKEDALVGALVLLLSEDVISWELRRPKDQPQRWYEGARAARLILDHADPGYRYYDPVNVQTSNARISNANWVAYVDIIAQPVIPLKVDKTDSTYGWLLEGTEAEARKIHGGTGVSPKLLHCYAQITRFAARMKESPDSVILPHGARKLAQRLTNFHQWSDLSPGYPSPKELLGSCELDANGQVTCPAKVTELTGETWVAAAQIYLQCRFFRRPRSHPSVREPLNVLLRCVERMPYTGPLFTSQSPFFPIFIMGVVSSLDEDRKVVREWFDTVLLGAGCRSSVPPVWETLKDLWEWMDNELEEDEPEFEGLIGDRKAWWEQMVERLMSTAGQISLA